LAIGSSALQPPAFLSWSASAASFHYRLTPGVSLSPGNCCGPEGASYL